MVIEASTGPTAAPSSPQNPASSNITNPCMTVQNLAAVAATFAASSGEPSMRPAAIAR
ncbi:Uncharacterised protein [Mycobacteroides abscessus]|nr:Uncharacterised protein [Mycobacteroides abscessus]